MKKTTIWILGIVMGLSFLSLLYLQISYIEEMATMRNEQFDESVKRALLAASKDVESEEVDRWLREDISSIDRNAWSQSSQNSKTQSQSFTITGPDGSKIELKTFSGGTQELPKAMISRRHGTKTIPQTSRSMAEMLRNRYLYQRDLLDEIAWQMVYNADVKPVSERINFRNLDNYIHSGLVDNGVNLSYHFKVIDGDGKEVYRCSDFNEKGSDQIYTQPLFLNDTPARMSMVQVHFPGKRDYIFDSVSFMIPSVVFTLVLLVTFIFTIYVIFRQKKLTEMKNDFINNMTHEFKTPISTISLAAQMLNDPAVSKSPSMFQHISGVINDETKRLRLEVERPVSRNGGGCGNSQLCAGGSASGRSGRNSTHGTFEGNNSDTINVFLAVILFYNRLPCTKMRKIRSDYSDFVPLFLPFSCHIKGSKFHSIT